MTLLKLVLVFPLVACGAEVPDPHLILLAVGARCDVDSQCASGVCVPVITVQPVGVCYAPNYEGCVRVLGDAWARDVCRSLGFTVGLCPRELERCVPAPGASSQHYPYQCCETTLFE